jgi:hypothetical protein
MVMGVGALQSVINYGIMGFTPSFLMKTYDLSMKDTALTFGLLSAAIGIVGPFDRTYSTRVSRGAGDPM